ncbi:MAG: hypothetical protein ACRDL7_02100 [Gaiellaceae bacterium]
MNAKLAAFCDALGRIGFDGQAKDAVVNQGFVTIDDLNVLGKDDIKRVCKIIRDGDDKISVPFMQEQLFEAMRYWVKTRTRRGINTSATLFNRSTAQEYAQVMLVDKTVVRRRMVRRLGRKNSRTAPSEQQESLPQRKRKCKRQRKREC